jgi:hypothetical protein
VVRVVLLVVQLLQQLETGLAEPMFGWLKDTVRDMLDSMIYLAEHMHAIVFAESSFVVRNDGMNTATCLEPTSVTSRRDCIGREP